VDQEVGGLNPLSSTKIISKTVDAARPRGGYEVLVGANYDRIVGFAMIGPEVGEVMAAIQSAMLAELPYTKLRDALIAHLTIAEGLGPLLANISARRNLTDTSGPR
jgi:pyruvate/2-oxoglutarate dehydrogenase complex dihydrolipoamide dehydrogenase (E3) component